MSLSGRSSVEAVVSLIGFWKLSALGVGEACGTI